MAFYEDDIEDMLDDFGVTAIVMKTRESKTVIFDNDYQTIVDGNVESSGPGFFAKETDFSSLVQGDTLTIDSTIYSVISVEPDGTGGLTVMLSED
jgi:hypothetical protein